MARIRAFRLPAKFAFTSLVLQELATKTFLKTEFGAAPARADTGHRRQPGRDQRNPLVNSTGIAGPSQVALSAENDARICPGGA
jgi:hypothetical protein